MGTGDSRVVTGSIAELETKPKPGNLSDETARDKGSEDRKASA